MEAELHTIQRIVAGDGEAYRELVERYHVGLIIHCENLLKNRHDAEDITQDVFVTAYQRIGSYDSTKGRFSTWLYRIATNKCLDRLRREKRHIDVEDIEQIAAVTMPTHIEDDEIRRLRQKVLELTPPEYRRVVEAYFWEGKSYQQIADELETNPSTVGVWLSRAKQQLREGLA